MLFRSGIALSVNHHYFLPDTGQCPVSTLLIIFILPAKFATSIEFIFHSASFIFTNASRSATLVSNIPIPIAWLQTSMGFIFYSVGFIFTKVSWSATPVSNIFTQTLSLTTPVGFIFCSCGFKYTPTGPTQPDLPGF